NAHTNKLARTPQRHHHEKKNTPEDERGRDQPQVEQSNKMASNPSDQLRSNTNTTPQQTLSIPTARPTGETLPEAKYPQTK
ncbi:hypothetical protein A2U01_0086783, partial [Trifolium medium]|nr:hypothetical protein [Trifolium medium]